MTSSTRRFLAATTACAAAAAGTLSMTTAPAQAAAPLAAKRFVTDYGFNGAAFGTYVTTGPAGVDSGRTAWAYLGCTRQTGITRSQTLTGAAATPDSPALKLGAVSNQSQTFRQQGGKVVGNRSTSRVADLRLGLAGGGLLSPNIKISALNTRAQAWADAKGRFHTSSTFSAARVTADTGTPLDNAINGAGVGNLIARILASPGDVLRIPGLGELSLGGSQKRIGPRGAYANATALQARLFGNDRLRGTNDDLTVLVGRTRATIARGVTAGVFSGGAHALDAQVLSGVAGVGRVGNEPLPCVGTNGKVTKNATADVDLGRAGFVQADAATGRVFGVQRSNGTARAWTEGSVARVQLGRGSNALVVRAIKGRANVTKDARGRISTSTAGSRIGSITFGGRVYDVPRAGRDLVLPGLGTLKFFSKQRTKTAVRVTALRITLLDRSGGVAAVNLGVATAKLRTK